jgi:hypothetical protein
MTLFGRLAPSLVDFSFIQIKRKNSSNSSKNEMRNDAKGTIEDKKPGDALRN